jgi:hypothetical protein
MQFKLGLRRRFCLSADHCAKIAEAARLYEALYPETRRGEKLNSGDQSTFSQLMAEKCWCSVSTVNRVIRVGDRIGPDVRRRIRNGRTGGLIGFGLFKDELYELARWSVEAQGEILDALEAYRALHVQDAIQKLSKTPGSQVRADLRRRLKSRTKSRRRAKRVDARVSGPREREPA